MKIRAVSSTVFADCFASCFYILLSLLYDIRLVGLENYRVRPATLIAINHKRDFDILIVGPFLHLRKTLFKDRMRMHFAARDDLFTPGFLTAHYRLPGFIGKIAHSINIAPIMRLLRAHPINHLVYKRIGSLMRDVIELTGDQPMAQVVKREHLDEFVKLLKAPGDFDLGKITIAEFLSFNYSAIHQNHTDMGILQPGLSSKVRLHGMKTVERQLVSIAHVLDTGGICLIAPEGHLSYDGKFSSMKSALYRLLAATSADVTVLPVNTTYDFMTAGRMRIYVTVGREMVGLKNSNKYDLNDLVRKNIVSLGLVTMGQLGSDYILQRLKAGFSLLHLDEFSRLVSWRASALKASGLCLEERLLEEQSFQKRLHDFLKYCQKKGILKKEAVDTFRILPETVLNIDGCNHWENPVVYSSNELHSLIEICLGVNSENGV